MAEKPTAAVLDFTNVKEGGAMFTKKHRPIGDYRAKVTACSNEPSKKDGTAMWLYTIELVDFPNSTYPYYCKLQDNQLWKVRNLFQAAGIAIPKKRVKLDPSRVIGKLIGVTLEDEEYDGKMQSVVDAIIPVTEVDGKVEKEEPDDVDEEGDEDASEEEDARFAEDRDGLKAFIRMKSLEIPIKKSMSDDDIRDAIEIALASASDEDEEEEEDEEPAPPKKSKRKATEDELDELDLDDL